MSIRDDFFKQSVSFFVRKVLTSQDCETLKEAFDKSTLRDVFWMKQCLFEAGANRECNSRVGMIYVRSDCGLRLLECEASAFTSPFLIAELTLNDAFQQQRPGW